MNAQPVGFTQDAQPLSGNVQTFVCLVPSCGRSWSRPATKGRPPHTCPDCRDAGRKPLLPTTEDVAPTPGREKIITTGTRHHHAFADLLLYCKARLNVMLVGPAGSGKTTAANQIAKALSLPVVIESCGPQMSKWDLVGFKTADGSFTEGIFNDAFENGGVVLLDEIDSSNGEVLTTANNIAAVPVGGIVTFGGRNVTRHPDFILIAGANTWGDGASDQYQRQVLDAATLDRFVGLAWGYDEELEFFAAGEGSEEWVRFVQKVRKACERVGSRRLVTPRASIMGAQALRAGQSRRKVERDVVFKGWSDDEIRTIKASLRTEDAATPA